jgi:hypothetical protein
MFLILALPRSRTFWLSKFLSYRDFECGHEESRHLRAMDDVRTWLTQDYRGSSETNAAPFWRLAPSINPALRIVTVRRPVGEVVKNLMSIDISGIGSFSEQALVAQITKLDAKLNQIERRLPNVLSVKFHELNNEQTIRAVWSHCLPYPFDRERWEALRDTDLQCNFRALLRSVIAYKVPMDKMAAMAAHHCRAKMISRPARSHGGVTFQQEEFEDWERDGVALFEAHCTEVGESPDNWKNKNIPLMRSLCHAGAMQITTARSNGRMFGYIAAFIAPSVDQRDATYGYHATRYVSPDMPGLALKLERASVAALRQKGASEVVFREGVRSEGPRTGVLYKRMGAEDFGHLYRLKLDGV